MSPDELSFTVGETLHVINTRANYDQARQSWKWVAQRMRKDTKVLEEGLVPCMGRWALENSFPELVVASSRGREGLHLIAPDRTWPSWHKWYSVTTRPHSNELTQQRKDGKPFVTSVRLKIRLKKRFVKLCPPLNRCFSKWPENINVKWRLRQSTQSSNCLVTFVTQASARFAVLSFLLSCWVNSVVWEPLTISSRDVAIYKSSDVRDCASRDKQYSPVYCSYRSNRPFSKLCADSPSL